MKIGIMQPYFMPYIGYFQLMALVDKYVIYDDVNYMKGGWINRNYFLIGNEKKMFTINLKEASPNKLINEIEIKDDFRRFTRMISLNYSKAPYFLEVENLINEIISFPNKNLARFIGNSFELIKKYLNINTELLYSSEIKKDNSLRGVEKVLNICSILDANIYVNAIGGQELYDNVMFEKSKIKLSFLQTEPILYKQFSNVFIPGLSFIDVLMFNSSEDVKKILEAYRLI